MGEGRRSGPSPCCCLIIKDLGQILRAGIGFAEPLDAVVHAVHGREAADGATPEREG